MKYGGRLSMELVDTIIAFCTHRRLSMFPGYGLDIIPKYFTEMARSSQYRIVRDVRGSIIAYADFWFLPDRHTAEQKLWDKPWPSDLNNGNVAYSYWAWVNPKYKSVGLIGKMVREFRQDFPEKTLCYHTLRHNNRFICYKPMEVRDAIVQMVA